jgi:chromosome segregation ATPase
LESDETENPNEIEDNPEIEKEKNHEAEFSQQERKLEEEIISLKIQLEEAKRMEEVMKNQMMKKEEEVEKLEEEVVMLRVKVVKLSKNLKKHPHHQQRKLKRNVTGYQKGRMKKRLRVTQKYLKEGIMVNKSPRGRIPFQEDHLLSDNKEDSTMIMINQGMNSEGLHHREDHLLPGIKVLLWLLFLLY